MRMYQGCDLTSFKKKTEKWVAGLGLPLVDLQTLHIPTNKRFGHNTGYFEAKGDFVKVRRISHVCMYV